MRPWIILAAVNGAIAVGFAAYGAHGLDAHAAGLVERASLFQLIHAAVLLALERLIAEGRRGAALAGGLFVAGMALFSGSLYLKALGVTPPFPLITPAGGIALMLGWVALIISAFCNK